jgi:hypothetical protein
MIKPHLPPDLKHCSDRKKLTARWRLLRMRVRSRAGVSSAARQMSAVRQNMGVNCLCVKEIIKVKTMLPQTQSAGRAMSLGNKARAAPKRATMEDLPPADLRRWSVRRKAEVVTAVADGRLTMEEACDRYSLSAEEFNRWQSTLERTGMRGLRVTRIQEDRIFFRRQH